LQQPCNRSSRRRHLLQVVEDQQKPLVCKGVRQALNKGATGRLPHAERLRDGGQHERVIGNRS
jgi:hypothetical protein